MKKGLFALCLLTGGLLSGQEINQGNIQGPEFDPAQMDSYLNPMTGLGVNSNDGTFSWKGRTFDIGTSRIFRARFERYLNQSERNIDDYEAYQNLLKEVLDLLSPRHLAGGEAMFTENVDKAYRKLYEASEYAQDGGTSRSLAHMIYNSWRLRSEIRRDIETMTEEERRIRFNEEVVLNKERAAQSKLESMARNTRQNELRAYSELGGNRPLHDYGAALEQERLDKQKMEQEIAKSQLSFKTQMAQFQFQSQIIYFMTQRRFEHALMASYFYRALFRGSAQHIQVGEEFMSKFLPRGDMVYTVESLEQIALEAIADTESSMDAIHTLMEAGDISTAMERLQESFFLGEYLGPVSTFPREYRQEVLQVYRLMREARELYELRDYDKLLEVTDQLHVLSRDSRYREVISFANNAKQMANLKLAEAKYLMQQNDFSAAQEALKQSAEIWPLNPEITKLTNTIFTQSDVSQTSVLRFDQAYQNQDYRSIFGNRHELGLGLANDPERSERLKEVMDKVGGVDLMLSQAKVLTGNGNHFGAWEMVLQAEELLPNDREVFSIKSRLISHTHEFSRTLETAKSFEERGNYVLSYTWYERAKTIYPASQIAILAQQRLIPLINGQLN